MIRGDMQAVVMGVSAGAVEALSVILPALPENYPLPIMIVVHVPPSQKSIMAELFQERCKLSVKEAEDKETLQAGTVYFAPPDYHLLVEENRSLSLSNEDPILYSRPSIDVLFESAADVFGAGLIGIILTGANADGANGLRAVADEGGKVIVLNPQEAHAAAMPEAALKACPKAEVLSLKDIVEFLTKAVAV